MLMNHKTCSLLVALLLFGIAQCLPYVTVCPPQWTTPPPPCDECNNCPPGSTGAGGPGDGGFGRESGMAMGGSDCSSCGGMPVWQVREAQVDYRLFDRPLAFTPAYGPSINLDLVYQTWQPTDAAYYPDNSLNPLFGPQWHSLWSSDLVIDGRAYWNYLGGRIVFEFDSDPNFSLPAYHDGSRVEIVTNGSSVVIGGRVYRSNGQVLEYLEGATSTQFLLSSVIDANGRSLTFSYDGYGRLDEITDATGGTTTFQYGDLDGDMDVSNDRVVTEINAPGNRTAYFAYDYFSGTSHPGWYLTNIIDTVGISSSFGYGYETVGIFGDYFPLETLTTPYGTTSFQYLDYPTNYYGLTLLITEPNGGQHLYLHGYSQWGLPDVPSSFDSGVIPTGLPLGTLDTSRAANNTFYWGPLQLAGIGNLDVHNWDWDEFKRARIRHWLGHYDDWDNHMHTSDTLSWEQSPSPDGTTEGQVTWYDYAGKDPYNPDLIGTGTQMPSVIARVLPDGDTWYQYFEYNSLGKVTKKVETYTQTDGNVGTRTNTYTYAGNGIDLVLHLGVHGEQVVSNYFGNSYHQVDASYDALNQETRYTYNADRQMTSMVRPSGLTTTNYYFVSGPSEGRLEQTIDIEINRVNSYTYVDDLVYSHTDERGLTVTNYWDGLQRLVGRVYPDGTSISNIYVALDITATKDRLGHWAYFSYNGIRQKNAEWDAHGVETGYGYCDCGALLSVTNAVSTPVEMLTSFGYDFQGNRLFTYYPDATETNWFDALGRNIVTGDAWGYRWFFYNNQGLLTVVSNIYGPESITVYDIDDHPLYVTDANGVTITNTYDDLHRLSTRTYPDGGVERFGYSARGLVAYTNQLDFVTRFVYDEASRKIAETNANNEVLLYTNNAAGDLLSLTDGENQTTRWGYDEYGRVTNKLDQASTEILRYAYDPNSRLTNRWSVAKGNTKYSYDAVGNLTLVNYPVSPDVTLQYDPLNRVTNMVDAVGTTKYAYAIGGQLWTEDGPWSNDTVTNIYTSRLRTGLRLQQPTGVWTNAFGYDAAKRLTSVTSPAGTFSHTLGATAPASALIKKLLLPNTSYITNTYDEVARMLSTTLKHSSHSTLNAHQYTYNDGHQRTQQTFPDSSTASYTYDSIGQLKVATSSTSGESVGYAYDGAWNLNRRTNYFGVSTFTPNSLNELTAVTDPSPTTINYTYDDNGNLTAEGEPPYPVYFSYDDENRLVAVQNEYYYQPQWRVEYSYDGMGRLRHRSSFYWDSYYEQWVEWDAARYLYDGWRVIQDRAGDNTPTVSYTRGTDLSGSLEGAGGIGGMLARSHGYSSGNWSTHNFYHADGNGNITYLVTSAQGLAASYRYDPYGSLLDEVDYVGNTYRFSSKLFDAETVLYYYGYRWYDANLQRWLNRDPLGDEAFWNSRVAVSEDLRYSSFTDPNLYLFVDNNPLTRVDGFGLLSTLPIPPETAPPPKRAPKRTPKTKPIVIRPLPLLLCIHRKVDPPRFEICKKTGEIDEPAWGKPGDPNYLPAFKICIYTCPKQGVARRYFPEGTSCEEFIIQPF
jgi:RHS repeat-associated protein